FKDAARQLQQLATDAGRSYPRTAGLEERVYGIAPDLLDGVDGEDLARAFVRAMTPKPEPRLDLYHVNPIRLTVAEAVVELADELSRHGRISFSDLTSPFVERLEVVVRFLALLEMYKQ